MNSGYDCEGVSEVVEVGLRFRSRSISSLLQLLHSVVSWPVSS